MTDHAVMVLITVIVGLVVTIVVCWYLARRHKQGWAVMLAVVGLGVTVTATAVQRPLELTWDDFFGPPNSAAAPASQPPSATAPALPVDPGNARPTDPPPGGEESPFLPPAVTSPTTSPASPLPAARMYLSELEGRNQYGIGPYKIAKKRYDRSVGLYCGAPEADPQEWEVPEDRTRLVAVVGIPDSDPNAGGRTAHIVFKDQAGNDLGKAVDVQQGQIRTVDVDLKAAVRLLVKCTGVDTESGETAPRFRGALGDARFES